jgi:hypothetical protein
VINSQIGASYWMTFHLLIMINFNDFFIQPVPDLSEYEKMSFIRWVIQITIVRWSSINFFLYTLYNLIIVIKFIFLRLNMHEFECVFLYFKLKCIIRLYHRRKVHIKLYNIWKFEKIGQNRGWVMRRFITATRITF